MPSPVALEDFARPDVPPDPEAGLDEPELSPEPAGPPPEELPPPPDPQAERLVQLARITRALEAVAAEQAKLRTQCVAHAAAALGAVAATLLPALARAGFAALVAETARTAARHGRWPELCVTLAPEAAEAVSGHLAGSAEAPRIRVEPAPGTPPGEAAITWEGGGAEIDAAAIADSVLTEFRQRLDSHSQTGA